MQKHASPIQAPSRSCFRQGTMAPCLSTCTQSLETHGSQERCRTKPISCQKQLGGVPSPNPHFNANQFLKYLGLHMHNTGACSTYGTTKARQIRCCGLVRGGESTRLKCLHICELVYVLHRLPKHDWFWESTMPRFLGYKKPESSQWLLSRQADRECKERERRQQGLPIRRIGRALPVQTRVCTEAVQGRPFHRPCRKNSGGLLEKFSLSFWVGRSKYGKTRERVPTEDGLVM